MVQPRLTHALIVCLALGLSTLCLPLQAEVDQHGVDHDWRSSPGHYTVLDFAASWCAPCRRSLPKLEAFAKEHPEIRVLIVSVDDEVIGRDRLVEGLSLTLPVIWDENREIANFFRPPSLPATVILNPEGEAIYTHKGAAESEWRRFLKYVKSLPAPKPPADQSADG